MSFGHSLLGSAALPSGFLHLVHRHSLASHAAAAPRLLHFSSTVRCQNKMDSTDEKSPAAATAAASSTSRSFRSKRKLQFGTTHVIQPRGEHRATMVWLHGLGDVGASWAEALEVHLPLENIKWIVPTAPVQPVQIMGGFPCNAWFDVGSLSEETKNDLDGLDASAAHVADLLSKEPSGIKLGIGGFSQGAATSLYSTVCSITGKYSDGTDYPCKLSVAVAISGWFPCSEHVKRLLAGSTEAAEKAADLAVFMGHGTADEIVMYKFGEQSAALLQSLGYKNLTFKTYKGVGHGTSPAEMDDVRIFLTKQL